MPKITEVNPQIIDSLAKAKEYTLGAVAKSSGAGKAYQAVAQSTAISIQDAADSLRNTSTITNTAIGVALAEWLATKDDEPYKSVITEATEVMSKATKNFETIGTAAATVLESYPSGE